MTKQVSSTVKNPEIGEPTQPGTSMKYLGGRPYYQYLISLAIASVFLFACYAAMSGVLLPNSVQTVEFRHYFSDTTISTVNDLAQLTDLNNQVKAGTATATAEQQGLIDLLGKYEASRASAISLMMGIGSFFTLFAQPIVGVLSDRWRSKSGRRAFWIVLGGVLGGVFMIALRYSNTIAMLTLFWTVSQISLNFMQAPLSTTVADRVPENRVGMVSGISGIGMTAGFASGMLVSGLVFNKLGLNTYFIFVFAVVVGALLFVTLAKDRSSKDLRLEPFSWKEFIRGFGTALKDRDFRWVWIARFMMYFGYTGVTQFTLYILQSHLQPALSASAANTTVSVLSVASLPGQLVMLLFAGKLSDKVGKRKPFVIGSSFIMAAVLIIPLSIRTLPAFFVFYVIFAAAYGIYIAVDVALVIDVLPDKSASGRDLGVVNVASNIGQMIAPVAAGQLVVLTSGYSSVFTMSIVAVVLSALAIIPIRRVK